MCDFTNEPFFVHVSPMQAYVVWAGLLHPQVVWKWLLAFHDLVLALLVRRSPVRMKVRA